MTAATATQPRRLPAKSFMTEAQLAEVRTRSPWRAVAMIVHAWAVILAAMAVAIIWPNPITLLLAIAVIGSRQLGLAILMHDGAHGLLATNPKTNLLISQWSCAYPVLAETRAYRRYHLKHHAHTQTEDDPDLVLSAPFPITEASYRRKFIRDITGQTGYEQRTAQMRNAIGDASMPLAGRIKLFSQRLGPQAIFHLLFFAVLAQVGAWWAYPVLWVVPLLTWYQVVTRIRNIAEHAVISDSNDPLRNTRTTLANWLERAFIAPYYVNYHLEHHLLFYVPAYNLPKVHKLLMTSALKDRVEIEHGYRAVLKKATTRLPNEDTIGRAVAQARRAGKAGSDQTTGGF